MKTILLAPDSFKGSLSAPACAQALADGVRDVLPACRTILHPVSDGGEGLVEVLAAVLDAELIRTDVAGPMPGQRVQAVWAMSPSLAVIEMAAAAGLPLVPEHERDPRTATTYGVGELIRAALDRGASSIIVGIGGSATNDGGAGMAEALGVRFLDEQENPLRRGGGALRDLARIDVSGLDARLKRTAFTVACDVQNPLTGPAGASAVYGPQKGATHEDVDILDVALGRYGRMVEEACGVSVVSVPGSGAAGGLGAGLLAFCGASLKKGIELVLDATGFDEHLQEADLVITGEGKIDAQTRFGKTVAGVLQRARRSGKPVAAVAGMIDGTREEFLGRDGFVDIVSLVDGSTGQGEAMRNAAALVRNRTAEMIRHLTAQVPEH